MQIVVGRVYSPFCPRVCALADDDPKGSKQKIKYKESLCK